MKSVIVLALLIITSQSENYTLVLNDHGNASCLDGTPPAIYIHEGSGANADKFLIYMQGGGACSGLTRNSVL